MNETTIAEESGKTHDYTQEWAYLGIRKDGKALNRGHALMHMLTWKYITITIAHTRHESIDRIRRNIAEKHKHRHNINMEANRNNEQTDHKNTHAIQHTRKSENKKRSEARSSRRRILTLQYEYE